LILTFGFCPKLFQDPQSWYSGNKSYKWIQDSWIKHTVCFFRIMSLVLHALLSSRMEFFCTVTKKCKSTLLEKKYQIYPTFRHPQHHAPIVVGWADMFVLGPVGLRVLFFSIFIWLWLFPLSISRALCKKTENIPGPDYVIQTRLLEIYGTQNSNTFEIWFLVFSLTSKVSVDHHIIPA